MTAHDFSSSLAQPVSDVGHVDDALSPSHYQVGCWTYGWMFFLARVMLRLLLLLSWVVAFRTRALCFRSLLREPQLVSPLVLGSCPTPRMFFIQTYG